MINFVLLISLNIFIHIHSLSIYPDHSELYIILLFLVFNSTSKNEIIFIKILELFKLNKYISLAKPCLPKDEWTEDCLKCFCTDEKKVVCQRTYCASKLYLEIDTCDDGDAMVDGCHFCTCINNYYVCEYNGCIEDSDEDED